MSEFTKNVVIPDNQPAFPFFHSEKEYRIYIWLQDGGPKVFRISLGEVIPTSSGFSAKAVPGAISGADKTTVDNAGGVIKFMQDVFLPKIQIFLDAQGGAEMPDTFPTNGTQAEQFNYIIENSLSYVNGKIVLTVS